MLKKQKTAPTPPSVDLYAPDNVFMKCQGKDLKFQLEDIPQAYDLNIAPEFLLKAAN